MDGPRAVYLSSMWWIVSTHTKRGAIPLPNPQSATASQTTLLSRARQTTGSARAAYRSGCGKNFQCTICQALDDEHLLEMFFFFTYVRLE